MPYLIQALTRVLATLAGLALLALGGVLLYFMRDASSAGRLAVAKPRLGALSARLAMSATATSPTDEPDDVADATEVAHNPARREQHRQSRSPESQS